MRTLLLSAAQSHWAAGGAFTTVVGAGVGASSAANICQPEQHSDSETASQAAATYSDSTASEGPSLPLAPANESVGFTGNLKLNYNLKLKLASG